MKVPLKWLFFTVFIAVSIGLTGIIPSVLAQGCSISSFTMTPTDPYTIGTAVILNGQSNCGTVRFEITRMSDNQVWHKAEIGTSNQTETWRTNETGSGNFRVCFVARGDGGWNNAARNCRTVYVEGSQAPPAGSQQGTNVRCWVNNLTVTPSQAPVGHTFQMSGQGQCDGNVRAVRFTINGSPWGEFGGNTTSSTWNSSGSSAGTVRICFQATAGEWSQSAESCTTITLTASGNPSNNVSQGSPATNSQPGQTNQSNPNTSSTTGTDTIGSSGTALTTNQAQNCNTLSRLSVGQIAVVSDATPEPLPLRSGPSTSNSVLVQVPVRVQLTIIGGPSCDGNLVWWETQYRGNTGWVSETTARSNYNLIPNGLPLPGSGSSASSSSSGSSSSSTRTQSCSGALSPTLSAGDRGRVTYTDGTATTMRDRPQGNVVVRLAEGTQFNVISDPTCTTAQQGHLWWVQVETDSGQTGWVPFGYSGGEYWIEAVETTTSLNQCRQGWTPPANDGNNWVPAPDFRIELQDRSMRMNDNLMLLASTVWYDEVANETREGILESIFSQGQRQWGQFFGRASDFIQVANAFFRGTTVATAEQNYRVYRQQYEALAVYDSPTYRCGNYVRVPVSVFDAGTSTNTFPNWWQIWSNYLPTGARQRTCTRFPDTCEVLGVSR